MKNLDMSPLDSAMKTLREGREIQKLSVLRNLVELVEGEPDEALHRLLPMMQVVPLAVAQAGSGNMVIMLVSNEINSTGCCTLPLPYIIQLFKDEDPSVREAILSSMAQCLPHFSKDAKKPVLLPLLRNLDFACQQNATNATQQQTTAQKQVSVENGTPPAVAGNAQQQKLQQLCVACRRMCAYNFPCFVAVFGEEADVFSGRLLPILEQFCRDSDDEVRSIIASGFHEIVAQRKIAPMGTKNAKNSSSISASVPLLLGPFVDLLSSGNADIVQQLTANLHRILPMLYAEISASATQKRTHLIFAKLDRILVNCNNLMKGSTGSWRAHEAYLNGIAVLRNLVSNKDLLSNFVPLLKQEVLTAVIAK